MLLRFLPFLLLLFIASATSAAESSPSLAQSGADANALISDLLARDSLRSPVPFPEVVVAAAGTAVLPVDPADPDDQQLIADLTAAADALLLAINQPNHPVHHVGRINEVSHHLEDILLQKINAIPGLSCTYPKTADGHFQRSGYPDLRVIDERSGRVLYLDPKLFATTSETSSFRTFYFEPKVETNKILEDAHHLILGIAHDGRDPTEERWLFRSWTLVDLAGLHVRLKTEFQASNRDLYESARVLTRSKPAPQSSPSHPRLPHPFSR